jgi:hypothetical protein
MSSTIQSFAPACGLALLLAACHPTGVETVSDLDVVATAHDSAFDFASANTYSLPTEVRLVGSPDGGMTDRVNSSLEQAILQTLQNQMDSHGYTRVNAGQSPDLVMTAAALTVTNIDYYYGYWYSYWGWYYPGYPSYPYYPPVVGVSVYTIGTLLVDMATAKATAGQLNGVWTAVVRGISGSSISENQIRTVNGINQAFIQSPYLGKP